MSFAFYIERQPSFVISGYVLMGWMLAVLSMTQFWLPEEAGNMDRVGLGITCVLASTVLQTEGKVSHVSTWLDAFFTICTTFQAMSFLITVGAQRPTLPAPLPFHNHAGRHSIGVCSALGACCSVFCVLQSRDARPGSAS